MISPAYLTEEAIHLFIQSALGEDIGEGDHSSLGAIPKNTPCKARLLVKDEGVIAGLSLAEKIFQQVDPALQVNYFTHDGDLGHRGEVAFEVTGQAQSILSAERLVLNCMQRMSGIATHTKALCQMLEGTSTKLLDTRKTTPNFRAMEKWAVAIGGGQNHRFALYDMVMLKDNHIDMAGGVQKAIENAHRYLKEKNKDLKIEIEVRNLKEVEEVIRVGGVDTIMLDNMSLNDMRKSVHLINGKYKTEASGGITENTLRAVAETGVDFISMGALTHSTKSLDLSLKVVK
ncbi:MAG: carboxylating nicotinate-nucleotide diphosphorylase [Cyclobacteriaceae bacterium]